MTYEQNIKTFFLEIFMILMIFWLVTLRSGQNPFFAPFMVFARRKEQIFASEKKKVAESAFILVGLSSNFQDLFVPRVLQFPNVWARSDNFWRQESKKLSKFRKWLANFLKMTSKFSKIDRFLAKPPNLVESYLPAQMEL